MIIRGTIRSTETWTGTAEALDPSDARAELEQRVPEGFQLARVTTLHAKIGEPYKLEAEARSTLTRELEAEGADYAAARAAFDAQIPEGWIPLMVSTSE
ncbi:hypothetical protein [Gryllotalpicola ginsengisoli]|uniref:hypothetical protein n=1 Tax=Gryllotalpicola ginsengisoli TaxID=444608 RepID=UPI0003B7429F|nr:hypothetical protein [Gryllotalpicola ginsengisoli]